MPESRLLHLSIDVYRKLLLIYPKEYRQEYGPSMIQVFRDLCRDAYGHRGKWGLARLWGCTLLDVTTTAFVEHWEVLGKRGKMDIQHRLRQAVPWLEIVLAAFLGMYAVALSLLAGPTTSRWPAAIGVGLWGTLAVVGLFRRVPSWSLPALGVLLLLPAVPLVFVGPWLWIGYPIVVLVLMRMRLTRTVWAMFILTFILGCADLVLAWMEAGGAWLSGQALGSPIVLLVPVLIGVLLARQHGLRAVLAVVAAETILYAFVGEPAYTMVSYPQGWIVSLAMNAPMLICPVWVPLARSPRWQRRSILWSWAGMLIVCVVVPGLLRSHQYSWSLWLRHICVAGESFLTVLLAVSLYGQTQCVTHPGTVVGAPSECVERAQFGFTSSVGAI